MQSDDFVAHEIVAGRDVLWDLHSGSTSVEKIDLHPVGTVGFSADLVDLEPFGAGLVELVACGGSTRGHVSQHRTNVMRPFLVVCGPPVEADGISRIGVCDEGSWAGIGATGDGWVCGTLVGILSADLANDARVGGPTWSISLKVFAVDRDAAKSAMGRYVRCSEESGEDELHCITGKINVDQRKGK